jgi:methylmalonyl-CoA/ethylmalonyl-CoA epimerase
MQEMWQNFGIGPWQVYIYEPNQLKDVKYFGKPSKSGMKVALAQIGNTLLELIEPIGKDNIYYAFIQKNGYGINHFGYYRVKSETDFFATIKKLETAGFPCIWSGLSPRGNRFAYIDTTKALHTVLEILWVNEKAPMLKPNRVFPENLSHAK